MMDRATYELTNMYTLAIGIGFVLLFYIVFTYRHRIKKEIKNNNRIEENEKRLQRANSLVRMVAALFALTLICIVHLNYMAYKTIKSEITERGMLTATDDMGAAFTIRENGLLIEVKNETDTDTKEYVRLANLQYEQCSNLTFTDFMELKIKSFLHMKWEDGIVTTEDMMGL